MTAAARQKVEDLIGRVALGDRTAFDALYAATSGRLCALCLSILRTAPQDGLPENKGSSDDHFQ